jgi:hypothetical protein
MTATGIGCGDVNDYSISNSIKKLMAPVNGNKPFADRPAVIPED